MSRCPRPVWKDETAEYRNPYERYKDTFVAESYDADRFAGIPGSIFDRLEKGRILDAFSDVPKEATILDAPCGTGRLAEALLEAGYRVFGVDISPAMLQVASRKLERYGSRFQTELGDLRELAEDNRRFDAALCARLLMFR
jgi:2-polyprenyl-3-methyl-5-hydroxy-6-metoxy-1,4-benzoquinol methylase